MGGAFQAIYLPMWQEKFVDILRKAGINKEAEIINDYDCTGYLCGPMYALYGDDDFLTTAGPLEFWIRRPQYEKVRTNMLRTRLWDAHLIGLSEMYFDLTGSKEREEGWYRKIAEDLCGLFKENEI